MYYENNGIAVFNPAYLIHIGNNKYEATGYLSEHLSYEVKDNKWIANTWFIGKTELNSFIDDEYMGRLISNLTGSADNDVVIKSVDGHGGSEVFLLENGVNNLGKRREILENYLDMTVLYKRGLTVTVLIYGYILLAVKYMLLY